MSNFTDFIGGSGGGGALEKDYVAAENISAGSPVSLRSDNKIENITGNTEVFTNSANPSASQRFISNGDNHSHNGVLQLSPNKNVMAFVARIYNSTTREIWGNTISSGRVTTIANKGSMFDLIHDNFIGVDNSGYTYFRQNNESTLTIKRNNSNWASLSIQNSNYLRPCGTAVDDGLLYVCRSTHLGSDGLCIFKINYDGTYGYGLRLGSTTTSSSSSYRTSITIDPSTSTIYVVERNTIYKVTDSGTAFTLVCSASHSASLGTYDCLRAFSGNIVFKGNNNFVVMQDKGSSISVSSPIACDVYSMFDYDSSGVLVRFGSDVDGSIYENFKIETYNQKGTSIESISSQNRTRSYDNTGTITVFPVNTNNSFGIFHTYNRASQWEDYVTFNLSFRPESTNATSFIGFIESAVTTDSTVTVKMKGSEFTTTGLTNGAYYCNKFDGSLETSQTDSNVFVGYAYNSTTLAVLGEDFYAPEVGSSGASSPIKSIQFATGSGNNNFDITYAAVDVNKTVVHVTGHNNHTIDYYTYLTGYTGTTASFYIGGGYTGSAQIVVVEYV